MSQSERRRAPRVSAYRPVRLRKPSASGICETLTKDLSVEGMRCLSPTWFPVATDVNVDLVLSDGSQPLNVMGRAVWFRMVPHSDQFEVGLSFQGMSEESKRRLSMYMQRLTTKYSQVPA